MDHIDIHVRPAKHEDFSKVMDINRHVYAGNDYLPSNYHCFISDPDAYLFVGELDHTIVCFMGYVMDGETEMVKIGLRMRPEYQGKGYMRKFMTMTERIMLAKFPSLQCVISAGKDGIYDCDEGGLEERGFKRLDTFYCIWWRMGRAQATKFYEDCHKLLQTHPVVELNNDLAMQLLYSEENLQHLCPSGYFIGYYNWLPRKVNAKNIRKCIATHRILATMETETKIAAISYVAPNQLPKGNIYCINYYHDNQNADTFISHLASHARHAAETTSDQTRIILHGRPQIDVDLTEARRFIKPYVDADSEDEPHNGLIAGMLSQNLPNQI